MIKTYDFNDLSELFYAYSPLPEEHRRFVPRGDCVTNFRGDDIENFDYISLITRKKYRDGVKITVTCSFDRFGAPCIAFSDDVAPNRDGVNIYGLHFEVVAYEGGCNMWRVVPYPERKERPIMSTKIAAAEFEIKPGELITMTAQIKDKRIIAAVNGHPLECGHAEIPESFHLGVTACEGPNRFYSMTIEE